VVGNRLRHGAPECAEELRSDPDEYQGFAWGMGIDRIAMLKYGMPDLRPFFEADVRWLSHYGFRPLDLPTLAGIEHMKFTLGWLKEHLDTDAALPALADKLTMIGLGSSTWRTRGAAGAVHDRARSLRRAASQRRPPARVHGRHRAGEPVQVAARPMRARA
jgi:hypothetical protein